MNQRNVSFRLAPVLGSLTIARLILNSARRFPYLILSRMAEALSVPRGTLEAVLSLEWATGAISPLAGRYIDRIGRKRMMLLGMAIFTVFSTISAFGQIPAIVITAFIISAIGKILFDPAMQAFIGDEVPYKRRGTAIGVTELAWSGALFLIGPLSAYLIVSAGLYSIFAILAAGGALALILLWIIIPADKPHQLEKSSGNLWRGLFSSPAALSLLAVSVNFSFSSEILSIAYEAWLGQVFVLTPAILSVLAWVLASSEVIGEFSVIGLADRFGKRRMLIGALLCSALIYFILPYLRISLPLVMFGMFLTYLSFEIAVVTQIPIATEVLPQARGTMMSANVAAHSIGRALGALIGGWMFRTTGDLILTGTTAALLNLLSMWLVWRFTSKGH